MMVCLGRRARIARQNLGVVLSGPAIAVAMVLATAPGAAAAGKQECGSVTVRIHQNGHSHRFNYHDVTVSGVTCSYAKTFIQKVSNGGAPRGWTYQSIQLHTGKYHHEVIWQHKGGKSITYKYSNGGR